MIRRFRIVNRSGVATSDLRRFFRRGLLAMKVYARGRPPLVIEVVASPIRSRGCAEVKGHRMVIAVASRSRFTIRRFARLFEHEVAHTEGLDHEDMRDQLRYSTGPTPRWAEGLRLRHVRRAPEQLQFLRRSKYL